MEEHQKNTVQSFVLVEPTAKKQRKETVNGTPVAKSLKIDEQKLCKGVESDILKHIKDVNDALNEKSPEKDEVVLHCESIVPQLRSLQIKKFRQLKKGD